MAISYFHSDGIDKRKSQKYRDRLNFYVQNRSTITLRMRYKCIDINVHGLLKEGKADDTYVMEPNAYSEITFRPEDVVKILRSNYPDVGGDAIAWLENNSVSSWTNPL